MECQGPTGTAAEPDYSVLRPPNGCLRLVGRGQKLVGTMEVTRAADEATRRLQGTLRKQANSSRLDLAGTSHLWHVQVEPSASPKTLAAYIQEIVDHLENAGDADDPVGDDGRSAQLRRPRRHVDPTR